METGEAGLGPAPGTGPSEGPTSSLSGPEPEVTSTLARKRQERKEER